MLHEETPSNTLQSAQVCRRRIYLINIFFLFKIPGGKTIMFYVREYHLSLCEVTQQV